MITCDIRLKETETKPFGNTKNCSINIKYYLKPYVEVEKADCSLFPKFILFLDPSHLYDTQTLGLGW